MSNNFDPTNFDGKPSEYEQQAYNSNHNNSYVNKQQPTPTQSYHEYTTTSSSNPYQNNQNNQHNQHNQHITKTYTSNSNKNTKPKKNNGKKIATKAGFVAAMMIVSTTFGFGGNLLANHYFGNDDSDNQNPSNAVVTQSIVNTSSSVDGKADISNVVDATANTVVEITTEIMETSSFMEQYVSTGAGSGVIITNDGYIITNNHVIEGASKITVTLKDGTNYEAKLIGTDPANDVAVIKVEATGLTPAVLGSSKDVSVGDLAIAIGNPLGQLGGTVTEGIISALDREITIDGQVMTLLQTSAAINPGNSGGGLFNSKGELIAIVNAKTSASGIEGLGFAIPIDTAEDIAKDLIEHGYVTGQIKMGVSFLNILDNQTAMQYRVNDLGVYVYQVAQNSDAEKAGLQSGDIVLSINGADITYSSQIMDLMETFKVGDTIDIVVKRNGQQQTIKLTFSEFVPTTNS